MVEWCYCGVVLYETCHFGLYGCTAVCDRSKVLNVGVVDGLAKFVGNYGTSVLTPP